MLKTLRFHEVGPVKDLTLDLATRLNLFTGDNGLGKTFVLDVAWWALTGTWAAEPAFGRNTYENERNVAKLGFDAISLDFDTKWNGRGRGLDTRYHGAHSIEPWGKPHTPLPGLVLYVRADGGCSLTNPYKITTSDDNGLYWPDYIHLSREEIWKGKFDKADNPSILGLPQDIAFWQNSPDKDAINLFSRIIELLSTEDEKLELGELSVKLPSYGARPIPTLKTVRGETPIPLASAGVKRILSFAYLLIWLWTEQQTTFSGIKARQFTLIFDEVEAHLHPKWQRLILPAIIDVVKGLDSFIDVQIIASTHSPLVLASLEPHFNQDLDKLFTFHLQNNDVKIQEELFVKMGDADNWLTEIFELKQPRSKPSEKVIEAAEYYLETKSLINGYESVEALNEELIDLLPELDPFLPRWRASLKAFENDKNNNKKQ